MNVTDVLDDNASIEAIEKYFTERFDDVNLNILKEIQSINRMIESRNNIIVNYSDVLNHIETLDQMINLEHLLIAKSNLKIGLLVNLLHQKYQEKLNACTSDTKTEHADNDADCPTRTE